MAREQEKLIRRRNLDRYKRLDGLPSYNKALKRLLKKFKLSEKTFAIQFKELSINPHKGDSIVGFPYFKKCRLQIPGQSGKRKGLRLIYYVDDAAKEFTPVFVYHKGEKIDLTMDELDKLSSELDKRLKKT